VDSVTPIPKLFQRVIDQFGRAPDFWGRYVTTGRSSQLQADEIPFLKKQSPTTRLVLVHNPLGPGFYHQRILDRTGKVIGFTPNPEREFNRGKQAALNAINAARGLGIQERTLIYMNIEPDQEFPRAGKVSPHFLRGWWEGMGAEFGGVYGNVSEFFDNQEKRGVGSVAFIGHAYKEALVGRSFKPLVWGQDPKIKKRSFPVPAFEPKQPPGVTDAVRIWQYGPTTQQGSFDLNLATTEAFERMLKVDGV
jgi:hypothetical protein